MTTRHRFLKSGYYARFFVDIAFEKYLKYLQSLFMERAYERY